MLLPKKRIKVELKSQQPQTANLVLFGFIIVVKLADELWLPNIHCDHIQGDGTVLGCELK